MPKTITSPVKRFAGEVVLSDPLDYPQALAVIDAINRVGAMRKQNPNLTATHIYAEWQGAIIACVQEWRLTNVPAKPEKLPATPSTSAARLATWLIDEITELFVEADDIPNG